MSTSTLIAMLIFAIIAVRQWLPDWLRIWHVMLAGAVLIVATGETSPAEAFDYVDWNIIAYLFGVFSIGIALYQGGVPHRVSEWLASHRHGKPAALAGLMISTGIIAAIYTNDAAAIIGTAVAMTLARSFRCRPTVFLIALCAAVTIGSMMTPVGNPQNILIAAESAFTNPFAAFLLWLAVPTVLAMLLAFAWFWYRLAKQPQSDIFDWQPPELKVAQRTFPAYLSAGLLVLLIAADSILREVRPGTTIALGWMGLGACLPVYLFGVKRITMLREVDWATLLFFVGMFVVTGSVLASGDIEAILGPLMAHLNNPRVISGVGFGASQLFSNVPTVEIYLGLLKSADTSQLILLAAMSTLAGNLFIISAASNVIVVQQVEKLGEKPFTFWEFTLTNLPVTLIALAVAYGWVVWVMGYLQ
jgi:Na+/H+ antiporter NhaD/arsenite permease-like protein